MRYHSQFTAFIMRQIFLQAITVGDGVIVIIVPHVHHQTSVYHLLTNASTPSP